jgi:hypothetical protein
MLRVDSDKPCKIVYSICKHDFLGYLIEPHIVQLNSDDGFSLTYQRLFTTTAEEFSSILDETDLKLIKLLEEIEQSHIIKRFHKKAIRPVEYFRTIFNEKIYEVIRPKIEKKLVEALKLIGDKGLFQMSKEGWPVERKLIVASEPASVLFHFRRNVIETRYFPTIKFQGQRIEFMFKEAQIICNYPAWLLLEDVLYYFEEDVEGKKLFPFLNKRFISIPKSSETTYFEKFVAPLIEKHAVYAEGFEIRTEKFEAIPILKLIHSGTEASLLQLYFKYGEYIFPAGSERRVTVRMEKKENDYVFHRIKRSLSWEKNKINILQELGLSSSGSLLMNVNNQETVIQEAERSQLSVINWLNKHHDELNEKGFSFEQTEGSRKYLIGRSKLDL